MAQGCVMLRADTLLKLRSLSLTKKIEKSGTR